MKKNTYNTKVRNTSHFIPTHTYNTYTIYQTSKILLNNINISYSIKTHILSIQFTLLKSYTNPIVSRSYRLDLSFFEEERGIKIIFQFLGRGGGGKSTIVLYFLYSIKQVKINKIYRKSKLVVRASSVCFELENAECPSKAGGGVRLF